MAITVFHLLWNPETYQKLKDELDEAFPVLSEADWTKLKGLPYLVSRHKFSHAFVNFANNSPASLLC